MRVAFSIRIPQSFPRLRLADQIRESHFSFSHEALIDSAKAILNGYLCMVYLLQTKKKSLKTGGPQYFLHGHSDDVREFLRRKGTRPVILQTPYGIVETPFIAVGRNHKLDKSWNVVAGRVGKDRIQQGPNASESIGEAIRRWYSLKDADFDRIDIEVDGLRDGHFISSATTVTHVQ